MKTYSLSDSFCAFAPPDLSGLVVLNKLDYSTIFVQADLRQYPQIISSSGSLNFELFSSIDDSDGTICSLRDELVSKKIMLEAV